ncbi:MAG: carbohydrate ABC transporter permease [Clostridia bacterium]|nr:carbohydrate ABC transporter permease [Clostridia bacterium]
MSKIVKLYRTIQFNHRVNKRVNLSRSFGGTLGIFIFLVLISAFMVLPLVYAVIQSLKPLDEIFAYPPRFFVQHPTLDNFRQVLVLTDNLWVPFARYLFNSLFITITGTGIYVFVSSMAAYPLAKAKFFGSSTISILIIWTLMFSGEVTAIPKYIVIAGLGLVDTQWSVILPYLSTTMGVFLMRQFMVASIPDSTLEAARIDGANEYQIFFRIIMPSVKPAWMTLIIFAFKDLWNSGTSAIYIYSEELKGLSAVMSSISTGGLGRTGPASAVAVLMMIPPIVIFLYSQSSVMETMTHSGLK